MKTVCMSVLAASVAMAGVGVVRLSAQAAPAKMTVTSAAFKEAEMIPKDYTGDAGAKNVSPPLAWSGAPGSTKEYAIILDDPDAAQFNQGQPYVHWIVYKIPGTVTSLPEALPAGTIATGPLTGAIQGMSNMAGRGRGGAPAPPPVFRGPAPPAGSGPHHYTFTVYALDAPLAVSEGLNKPQLLEAMKGHIVGEGKLIGIYQR
jgi:Raf kinase inhibitor-like YbhB/YbcL family protein